MIKRIKSIFMASILLISTITCFIYFIPVEASGNTWYVATTGSDTAPGDGSIEHPYATVQKAINVSSNSDTVIIRGGNYIHEVHVGSLHCCVYVNRSGTKAAPYTIKGFPGEKVTIDGTGIPITSGYGIVSIGVYAPANFNNITLKDFIIANSTQNGISAIAQLAGSPKDIIVSNISILNSTYRAVRFWNAEFKPIENITFSNCTFYKMTQPIGTTTEGITFKGCNNIIFCYNDFSNCIHNAGVDFVNSSYVQIYNNNFHGYETGHFIYLDASQVDLPLTQKNSHFSIERNYFGDNPMGALSIGAGEYTGGSIDNITVSNNIINLSGNRTTRGIALTYPRPHNDITIIYNTIIMNSTYSTSSIKCIFIDTSKLNRTIIANNIFVNKGTPPLLIYAGYFNFPPPTNDLILANNLYNNTNGTINTGWKNGEQKYETSAVYGYPEFINIETGNFHLNRTSPAIDAATSLYTVAIDYDGNSRPQGEGYDIGAYEYVGISYPVIMFYYDGELYYWIHD